MRKKIKTCTPATHWPENSLDGEMILIQLKLMLLSSSFLIEQDYILGLTQLHISSHAHSVPVRLTDLKAG